MKNLKKFLSIFVAAFLCLGCTIVFAGCDESEFGNTETFILTDVLESGTYKNMDESKNDCLVINDDNTISLVNFDGHELAVSYAELLGEAGVTEDEFCELLKTPYQTTVYKEAEEAYVISVQLFGDDSNIGMNFKYNSEDKAIFYHSCFYKKL